MLLINLYGNDRISGKRVLNLSDKINITVRGVKYYYMLDSAAIIDTKGRHFCCLITYDKKQYGFDGASFKRLNPFNWISWINKNKEWTFEGSNFNDDPADPIKWNFMNGYVELFYYRV